MGQRSRTLGLAAFVFGFGGACTSPPGALPMTHALAHLPGSSTVGAMVSGTGIHARRGNIDDERNDLVAEAAADNGDAPSPCAVNGGAVHDFLPAAGDSCIVDWQLFGLTRRPGRGQLSLGALAFGGDTTDHGGGLMLGAHVLDRPRHAVTIGAALGPVWLAGAAAYSYRASDRLSLFIAPEYRATSDAGPRVSAGIHFRVAGPVVLSLETGLAHREAREPSYSYRSAHVGLGVRYLQGARTMPPPGEPDWNAPWAR